jgi:riboflavin kinase/FMN adenylyltransferase
MKVARHLREAARDPNSVVTIGTFDGVHLGHRAIIRKTVAEAQRRGGRSVAITFDPHPKEVVASPRGPVALLSTVDERIQLIGGEGVDLLLVLEFTYEFSRKDPREFYREYVVGGIGVAEVVVGYDHSFGRDRQGGMEDLLEVGRECGFTVVRVPPFLVDGVAVSSTAVRNALAACDTTKATRLLGRPYSLRGRVVEGDHRGRSLGYPTANIEPDVRSKMIPARGVYAVRMTVGTERFGGMMNIGVRPSVAPNGGEIIEVHLFDASRDLYGAEVEVELIAWLRAERKFGSLEELKSQLADDRERARGALAGSAHRADKP